MTAIPWQKGTFFGADANVEVAFTSDSVLVRNTRTPEQAPLHFTLDEWHAFIRGVLAGEFDVNK